VQLSRNRVEALTDGVFAVAMTLLVLDIKVPELQAPSDISPTGYPTASPVAEIPELHHQFCHSRCLLGRPPCSAFFYPEGGSSFALD
jgi:Endosomal/lysosomal potassium channel TMEM175